MKRKAPPKKDQPIPYRLGPKALSLEPPTIELRAAPLELELELEGDKCQRSF